MLSDDWSSYAILSPFKYKFIPAIDFQHINVVKFQANLIINLIGLPSFPELVRKHIYLFVEKLENSKNHIIFKLVQSVVPLFSNIWKFWFKQTSGLYVWFYTILWSFHIVFIFYLCTGFINRLILNSLICILYMDIYKSL